MVRRAVMESLMKKTLQNLSTKSQIQIILMLQRKKRKEIIKKQYLVIAKKYVLLEIKSSLHE
jgi:hypothetical protein